MNLSEQLNSILEKKAILMDRYRLSVEKFGVNMQTNTMDALINDVLSQLTIKDGKVVNNQHNIRLLAEVDRTMNRLNSSYQGLIGQLNQGFTALQNLNNAYFGIVISGSQRIINQAAKSSINTLKVRLGIAENGNLLRSGWLPNLIEDKTVLEGVRQILFKNVVSQTKFSTTLKSLKDYVEGTPEKGGAYEKYMKNTLYDIYQQYDAAYALNMANELGLKYFLYTGGLVKDSRDFCREHDGHVYTIEDTETWATWVPADSIHIDTFNQKDEYSVPSYLGYPGYNPLIDRGGYNCRHQLGYISEGVAKLLMESESN
jgi:hypothetical protein